MENEIRVSGVPPPRNTNELLLGSFLLVKMGWIDWRPLRPSLARELQELSLYLCPRDRICSHCYRMTSLVSRNLAEEGEGVLLARDCLGMGRGWARLESSTVLGLLRP